jgi:hypothetical protein
LPRQRLAQRIDERAGTYRLTSTPIWLDSARYRPATRSDFTVHGVAGNDITVTFNHGRGCFDDVGLKFSSGELARTWIAAALASGEWHVQTN